MVKPILSIKLKETNSYYTEDETISFIVSFESDKVLKGGFIGIKFIGRSSSHINGSRQHQHSIFDAEATNISIEEYNNTSNIKKMHHIESTIQVPNGKDILSYRNLDGGDGGKIEYMIEASLETPPSLFSKKTNVLASHIIPVPLVAIININENGLDRHRDASIRWPKNEGNANTCVLSARTPHEGCLRGNDVSVRVEFQQPKRFDAIKKVKLSLIQQETIASSKDKLPEMTKQLADRIITTEEQPVSMINDMYNQLHTVNKLLKIKIPSNTTPTIGPIAKVMRIDYKIRVTVVIIENSKEKELSVNLPIVVGTAGDYPVIHDSGIDTGSPQQQPDINNHVPYSPYPPMHNPESYRNSVPYPPPPATVPVGGFQMPEVYPPTQQHAYPPLSDRFFLNPEQMAYSGTYEGNSMPVPTFSSSEQTFTTANSPANDQVYPPVSLKSQMSVLSVSTNDLSADNSTSYPPTNMNDQPPVTTPTTANGPGYMGFSAAYEKKTDVDTAASSLSRESTRSTANSSSSHGLYPPAVLSMDKPNTPTPPHTPAASNNRNIPQRPTPVPIENGSIYHSGVSVFDGSSYSSSPPPASHIATRIDPIYDSVANNK